MTQEEWRPIVGYEGLYEVSNMGNVRSLDRIAKWSNGKQNNGYKGKIKKPSVGEGGRLFVNLYKNGQCKRFSVSALVASAFLINPLELPCVTHINGVVDDNRAENLRYISYEELNKATALKKMASKPPKPEEPIFVSPNEKYNQKAYDEEEWLDIAGYEGIYQISSKGRVRSVDRCVVDSRGVSRRLDGKILKQHFRATGGYPSVHLYKDGVMSTCAVHRLVARAFIACGKSTEGFEVDHIDCCNTNNDVNNLRYITHAQNMEHMKLHGRPNYNTDAITTPEMRKRSSDRLRRPVVRSDGKTYESISEAAKDIGRTRTAVGRAVNTLGAKCAGYTFKFLERPNQRL